MYIYIYDYVYVIQPDDFETLTKKMDQKSKALDAMSYSL